jgi:hypothetical protein
MGFLEHRRPVKMARATSSDNLGLPLPSRGGQSITQTPQQVPIITLPGISLADSVLREWSDTGQCAGFCLMFF